MIPTSYLVSTLVMGVFLVVLAVAVGRANVGRRYRVVPADLAVTDRGRAARRPPRWERVGVGVLLLLVAAGVGGLLVAGATDALRENAWLAAGGMLGAVVVGYLAWGVHHSVRYRGRPNSVAVGMSVWALGLLFVAAVAAKLVLA